MFREFLDANRQSGSTTELVWSTIRCNGYLVVSNQQSKKRLVEKHPALKVENVFTLAEIKDPNGRWRGLPTRPVFIDVAAIAAIPEPEGIELMGLTLREIVKRAERPEPIELVMKPPAVVHSITTTPVPSVETHDSHRDGTR